MSEQGPTPQKVRRRRRANVAGGRRHVHRVKVTPEEEARLFALAEAQRVTVPRLLVEAALSAAGETSTQRRDAMITLLAVYRQLAGVANNLNQIARAANTDGRAPVGTAEALREVRSVAEHLNRVLEGLAGR